VGGEIGLLLQVDVASLGPRGMLGYAWTWLARHLNHLPVNRLNISTLECFLKVAGYRLHQAYGPQFIKVLAAISTQYVPKMQQVNDADARAATTRLMSYINQQEFRQPPEGRIMPDDDESSYVAC
jgi:nucleoporin GLE1